LLYVTNTGSVLACQPDRSRPLCGWLAWRCAPRVKKNSLRNPQLLKLSSRVRISSKVTSSLSISGGGAFLSGLAREVRADDLVSIEYQDRKGRSRVVWAKSSQSEQRFSLQSTGSRMSGVRGLHYWKNHINNEVIWLPGTFVHC
jgi:hypothetical protein